MTVFGADYLGGRHYTKAILATHPKRWAGGIFLTTFGDARKAIKKLCQSGKFSDLVIHLAPFDKSHKYPINTLKKSILKAAKWCEKLQKECSGTHILISPFCEHNHSTNNIKPLFDAIKKVAPSCLMLNSIWKGGIVPGVITEIHLTDSKPKAKPKSEYTIAFDGFGGDGSGDFTDADVEKILARYPDARHIRLWNFRYNGKFGHKDTTSVSKRKCWPTPDYLRGHNAMMKKREGSITWPSTALYKPFADDHGGGAVSKDNKAMAIISTNAPFVLVKDKLGNVIDKMVQVKPPHTGNPPGPRYYASKYAYQLADAAEKETGSRLIKIDSMPFTDGDLRSGRFK